MNEFKIKTPIQELIEKFNKFQSESLEQAPVLYSYHLFGLWFFNNTELFLEKEKEVIEKAWWAGHDEGASDHIIYPSGDCNGYYNETFNTKEVKKEKIYPSEDCEGK